MKNNNLKIGLTIIWWARFCFKTLLLSLQIPYGFFRRVGLFRHGTMDMSNYANGVWNLHFNDTLKFGNINVEASFLELGPGDSLNSALKAKEEGFKHAVLVDIDSFAVDSVYVLAKLNSSEIDQNSESSVHPSFVCEYLTEGETSLVSLPDCRFSFVFSNSVLQHVGYENVKLVLEQLYRVSDIQGLQSHVIDLRDMIDRSSNHHHCPIWIWESDVIKKLPIYTNRLDCSSWIEAILKVGFEIIDLRLYDDSGLILNPHLSSFDPNYLTASIHLILRKN